MTPLVTVLLPVRDGARHLVAALDSIRGQSLTAFECLVVDDGSTDATPGLLAAYAAQDNRLQVLRQGRLGLVAALNRGVAAATAPLVARMDADDVAHPERLARQHDALAANPDLALVCSGYEVIDAADRVRRVVAAPGSSTAIAAGLQARNCIAHPTVMMRRAAVLAAGMYRAQFPQAEDYDLWLRLSERHRLGSIDATLLRYREHANQVSWRGHEQRILSELLAQMAAAARRAGGTDPTDGVVCADRDALRRAGWSAAAVAQAVASRAVNAARDATRAGHRASARAAMRVALAEPGLRLRARGRCWMERVRLELG